MRKIIILVLSIVLFFCHCESEPSKSSTAAEETPPKRTVEETPPIKAKAFSYHIPEPLKVDVNLEPGMCEGEFACLVETFLPIGWSEKGHFAYLLEPTNEAVGGYSLKAIIIDLNTDKVIWQWAFDEHEVEDWSGEEEQDIVAVWNKNKKTLIQKFREFSIQQQENIVLKNLPFRKSGKTFTARLDRKFKRQEDFDMTVIASETLVVNGENLGTKKIYSKEYKDLTLILDTALSGVIESPFEERIAFVKVNEQRGWEGPPNVLAVEIIGCRLDKGFK